MASVAVAAEERSAVTQLVAIAGDESLEPMARAFAVWQLGFDAAPAARGAVIGATTANHPAIRLAAISMLGEAPHFRSDAAIRHRTARALFAGLEDAQSAVRITALLALVNLGSFDYDPATNLTIAVVARELRAWAALHDRDADLQRSMGVVHLLIGEAEPAARVLETSLTLDREGNGTRYLLALARLLQRRPADARALLLEVPESDKYFQHAHEQLKQLP